MKQNPAASFVSAAVMVVIPMVLMAFPGAKWCPAQIIISEYLPAPDGAQEEFIELMNVGDSAVPLGEIAFRDDRSDWIPVATDSPLLLAPGELLVLSDGDQPVWPGISLLHPVGWTSLNNSGDSIAVAVRGAVTDRLGYHESERGVSLERIDPGVPGHVQSNWDESADPSGGTPGRQNSRHHADATPPFVRAAELAPPSSLILWMSEAVDRMALDAARIVADGLLLEPAVAVSNEARVEMILPDGAAPQSVSAAGLVDYAGHRMRDTTLSTARPAGPADVWLSEMLVHSGTGPNALPEFVELATSGTRPVSLRGSNLEIGSGPEPDVLPLSPPDDTRILQPNSTLVVFASPASGATADHLRDLLESAIDRQVAPDRPERRRIGAYAANPSRLALRNSGDLVRIVSRTGEELDAVHYDAAWNDIRFNDHRERSIRRVRMEASNIPAWSSTLHESGTTPGVAASAPSTGFPPAPGDLVFSELMPRPLADPYDGRNDQMEFVEFANVSGRAIELNGLMLAGPPADDGMMNGRRLVFQPLTLPPGAVAVVYDLPSSARDDVSSQLNILAEAFPEAYASGIGLAMIEASLGRDTPRSGDDGLLIPVRGTISLGDEGESLHLLASTGAIIDSVTYSPAMHHPAVVDPTGRALARTVVSLAPLEFGGWSTSTAPGGGTPGLLPPRPGPPPSHPSSASSARLAPSTITPDGNGFDDLTVIRVDNLTNGSIVRIDVYDIDGRPVRTIEPGILSGDSVTAEWSGLDDARRPVARGFYVVLVRITKEGGHTTAFRLPLAVVR